jgi:hypothetical protein
MAWGHINKKGIMYKLGNFISYLADKFSKQADTILIHL